MSTEPEDLPDEESVRNWRDRVARVVAAGVALLETRLAIFRTELAEKRSLLLKGLIATAIGLALAAGVLLLLIAFLAALLIQLIGNVALGLLATLVLFAAAAAAVARIGVVALSKVQPSRFPAAQEELSRDWSALRSSWSVDGDFCEPDAPSGRVVESESLKREEAIENLEERFRAGAE